jgi:hypothetical protein
MCELIVCGVHLLVKEEKAILAFNFRNDEVKVIDLYNIKVLFRLSSGMDKDNGNNKTVEDSSID